MSAIDSDLADRMEAQFEASVEVNWEDVLRRAGVRRRRFWRRRFLMVLPAGLVVVAGASAATGVLSLGDVVSGHGFGHTKQGVRETVVAKGASPLVGRWRIVTFSSKKGLLCLKARLLDDPRPAQARGDGGYCAGGGVGSFGALSVGGPSVAARRGSVVVFGPAPRRVRSVVLTDTDGGQREVEAQHPPGQALSYWLIAAPPRLAGASVRWRYGRGGFGRSLDVSSSFAKPIVPRTVLRVRTPVAGPVEVRVSESERQVSDGSIVEPEGLPCVELRLLRSPLRGPSSSQGCGSFRRAPGFFKVEARVPNGPRAEVREVVLYGRAPAGATRVELVRRSGPVASVAVHRGPAGTEGRFWVLPVAASEARGVVRWVGHARVGPRVAVFGP